MISVVTITYNNYEQLIETMDSIKGLSNIESIVVNGGDCEKTRSYLSQIDAQSVSEPDKGISDAFNKGLNMATGDSVVFLNSGDVLLEKEYFNIADDLLNNDPGISFVHGAIIFTDPISGATILRPALCCLGRGMPYFHQSMVVRRSVFDITGAFKLDYKYCMDFEFVCRMEKAGLKGYYWNKAPIVLMDGNGISKTQEFTGIRESSRGLKENNLLNAENYLGLFVRYGFYLGRELMIKVGLTDILAKLKILKHSKRALK